MMSAYPIMLVAVPVEHLSTSEEPSYSCGFSNDHKLIAGDAGGPVYFLKFEQSKRKR
jgi:hypothetical protein